MRAVEIEAERAIALLRERPRRLHVVATGAGAGIQAALWATPGCSDFLAGASFPYATDETGELLGFLPQQYVSVVTAGELAMAAYRRAFDPLHPEREPVGLGVTAAVATSRQRRGDYCWAIACMTRGGASIEMGSLDRAEGAAAREEQGRLVDAAALGVLADTLGGYKVLDDPMDVVLELPCFRADGRRTTEPPEGAPLFPGAFDPPHEGHLAIAEAVARRCGRPPVFAITAEPPHKPPLSAAAMLERVKRLRGQDVLFTLGDPLYLDKARRFPGRPIVLGADALERMLDPKWGVDLKTMSDEFRRLGTTLLVFGREVGARYVSPEQAIAPLMLGGFYGICEALPGRWDVSSTALRAAT